VGRLRLQLPPALRCRLQLLWLVASRAARAPGRRALLCRRPALPHPGCLDLATPPPAARCPRHPEFIKSHWVKPGAVVIDVGINVVSSGQEPPRGAAPPAGAPQSRAPPPQEEQRQQQQQQQYHVVGDVAYPEVVHVAGAITPVPGGVGPMTIAAVLHNTLLAAKYRAGLVEW
jgi:hypothetical protein